MLVDSVRHFVDKEYDFEQRMSLLRNDPKLMGHWQFFANNGWLAAALPEKYDGLGGSVVDTVLIMEQFGRGLVVEPYLGCGVFAPQTVLAAASEAQKENLLPGIIRGASRLAVAYSEASSRGDPSWAETTAAPSSEGYVLHGRKTLVLGGMGASAFIVSARMAHSAHKVSDEISLFLVDADVSGLSIQPWRLHDGSYAAEITLDQVRVGKNALLGASGSGLSALQTGLTHAIAALGAELVGGMDKAIEITAEYLRVRHQFGVPIASFQALQHRMADMAAETELARSMLYALLAAIENEIQPAALSHAVSQAKALICRSARYVCGQAIQLHGGIGMTEECAIGHYFKRAIVADLLFGSADLHDEYCAGNLQNETL